MSLILAKKYSKQQINLLKVIEDGRYIEMAIIGEEYSVIDDITKKTPEDIILFRQGNNLIISSKNENIDVVIHQFWHKAVPSKPCFAIFDLPAEEENQSNKLIVTEVNEQLIDLIRDCTGKNIVINLANNQRIMLKEHKISASDLSNTSLRNNCTEEDFRTKETIDALRKKIELIQDNQRNQIAHLQNKLVGK
ncbi:hypothetical protein [Gallibacterium genomosp. 2]|uniref:hypothetical protein n=1 Tax=Gallibacterium genomosp. 2 TaxID=155517 RepID=UPI00068B877A|nr:hypothetical protein [Gallibacterium genomosp. 2]